METTGVVRRIDDLGRIVIPKEIRRTLKIKDGASLEIFVEKDMVALKRHSSTNGLGDAEKYAEVIYNTFKNNVLITDRDNIIAVSGNKKKELTGLPISKNLEECIEESTTTIEKKPIKLEISEGKSITCSYVIENIISNGESVGLVIITSEEELTRDEETAAKIAAQFLGKHIEE